MEIQIRPLRKTQWRHILAIYREGMATGQATFETTEPSWQTWNESHLRVCRIVATLNDEVGGWAALSPVSRRQVYRGVAEVSVYVAEIWQGKGVGRTLLDHLIRCAEDNGIWMLQASILPENEVSLRLHEACGFRLVGRREKIAQHSGTWRDTLLMERRSRRVGWPRHEND